MEFGEIRSFCPAFSGEEFLKLPIESDSVAEEPVSSTALKLALSAISAKNKMVLRQSLQNQIDGHDLGYIPLAQCVNWGTKNEGLKNGGFQRQLPKIARFLHLRDYFKITEKQIL